MRCPNWVRITGIVVVGIGAVRGEKISDAGSLEERELRAAGVATGNENLLTFLRVRSAKNGVEEEAELLIQRLVSTDFQAREEAAGRLVVLGQRTLEILQKAEALKDLEVAKRVRECRNQIERSERVPLPWFAIRLLSKRQPPGTAETFLRYLPYASDEVAEEELWNGLDVVAMRSEQAREVLAVALSDSSPERRAVAAAILGRRGNEKQRIAVQQLLRDKDPRVRLRAAQGLLAGQDRSGLPILIALLAEPAVDLSWSAEELLRFEAGDSAPKETVGSASAEERQQCRAAWERWWKSSDAHADPVARTTGYKRPTLLLACADESQGFRKKGRVWLIGCDGIVRWERRIDRAIQDAQLIEGNRVLLAECGRGACCVTERTLTGELKWEKPLNPGQSKCWCKRLPFEHTFIFSGAEWAEINRHGERVSPEVPDEELRRHTFSAAIWNYHSRVLCIDRAKPTTMVETNPVTGQVVTQFRLQPETNLSTCEIEPLANGNCLLILPNGLQEVSLSGNTVWKVPMPRLWHAIGFRNGHVLAVSDNPVPRIVELTRAGRAVWEVLPEVMPNRVRACLSLVSFGFDQPPPESLDIDSLQIHIQSLSSPNSRIRCRALLAIRSAGPLAAPAIPRLIDCLDDSNEDNHRLAVDVLTGLRDATIPALTKELRSDCPNRVIGSAAVIANLTPRSEVVAKELVKALANKNARVRDTVVLALGEVGPVAREVVPTLTTALRDPDDHVRWQAAQAIRKIGPPAKDALPALLEAMEGSDPLLRGAAGWALGALKVADAKVIRALRAHLTPADHPYSRAYVAAGLGELGLSAAEAVPELVAMLHPRDVTNPRDIVMMQRAVVGALHQIGEPAKAAVPHLVELMRQMETAKDVRVLAIRALGRIGPRATSAIPALTELLSQPEMTGDEELRQAASETLKALRGGKD